MSKELEALERIRSHNYHELPKRECLRIIETALKDYDRRLKLAKEYEDVNNVAKRLKALEIIKEIDKTALLHFLAICVKDKDKHDFLKEVLL